MSFKKRCLCEYDGREYHGWQYQENGNTIQAEIERVLEKIFKQKIRILGSGRTDTGVHAVGQVFHFTTDKYLENQALLRGMNAMLPRDITISDVQDAEPDFHAIFSTVKKTYLYRILNRAYPSALENRRAWWLRAGRINADAVREMMEQFLGTHDFTSFCVEASVKPNPVRTILSVDVRESGEIIEIRVTADGFMHNMMRIMVGTVVSLLLDNRPSSEIPEILAAKNRKLAGRTAPPDGLYLEKVYYE